MTTGLEALQMLRLNRYGNQRGVGTPTVVIRLRADMVTYVGPATLCATIDIRAPCAIVHSLVGATKTLFTFTPINNALSMGLRYNLMANNPKSGLVTRKRRSIPRRKLYSSAQLWKPAPAGFNEKFNVTGDFYIPVNVKRPSKRTLTLPKIARENLKQARGAKRARVIARIQHSVESVAQRKTPIIERASAA
jgi:hypothetical protein